MKPEDTLHPTDEWFDEDELDEEFHVFSYTVNGEKKQIGFWIRSISTNEARLIAADCENEDGTLDDQKHTDAMILACVSYGPEDDKKKLSRQMLDSMKNKKKGGIGGQILAAVLLQSGADEETIESEKNLDGPIASFPS